MADLKDVVGNNHREKMDNRHLLEAIQVEEDMEAIDNSPEEVDLSIDEMREAARLDLNFLAALAMPEDFIYEWPDIFIATWALLVEKSGISRDFSKLALGFPRGHAKTTFLKLCVLWLILFSGKRFISISCASGDLAINFVEDVADMLSHPNIRAVFGDWDAVHDSIVKGDKQFYFRGRSIRIKGLGAGAAFRGIIRKNQRPDVMIFDDVQTKEQSESKAESMALEKWFWSTAMKAKSPHGCMFVFLANMYPTENSLLRKLKHNRQWIKLITGAILTDGKALWEELQPLEQLLAEYQSDCDAGHPEIFLSEVMNDENVQMNNMLDVTRVKQNTFEYLPDAIPHGKAIVIDPALDKKDSDLVSIGYHEYFDNPAGGHIDVFTDLVEGHFSPGATIKEALLLAITKQCRLIVVEGVAYQQTLLYWFEQICLSIKLEGVVLRAISPNGRSKNSRVFNFFKSLHAGETVLHSNVRATVINEGVSYNPAKTDNVDGALDVGAYGRDILAQFPAEIISDQALLLAEQSAASDMSTDYYEHNSII